MKTLAIITESIRRDLHRPLKYFKKFQIVHFYEKAPYGDLTAEELKGAIQFENLEDLRKKLLELYPDIIQGPEPYGSRKMLRLAWKAYQISKKTKSKLIIPVLENRPVRERFGLILGMLLKLFFRFYAKRANLIFYHNEGARRNLLEVGVNPKKLFKLPWGLWGVDTEEFSPQGKKADLTSDNDKIILFVGRLDEAKGLPYLLEAFKMLQDKRRDCKLILIGKGELEEAVKEFIKKNNLEGKIEMLGVIPNKDLPPYFRAARVSVYPSITLKRWEEQLGTVNLQAMACGVPVVSTKSGAIPEYVPDGKVGILVKERDPEALAKAIEEILENPHLAKKLGEGGRRFTLEHYQSKKVVERAERIIWNKFHLYS